ncbi:MAG: ribosome biogenesis/translation initiation ATPase RLI [Candidatus Aenigmatarchaeota archaeon]
MSRIVVLDKELCNPGKCNYLCISTCPKNRSGEKCITKDEKSFHEESKLPYPRIDENICIGCALCSKRCNFKALKVVNLPEAIKEDPIFQYGVNGFRLFRLPILTKGIIGILGENGTGKTTAINILAGNIKPNLGREEANWNEIIKLYRGTELYNYLKMLAENKARVSFKKQQPDELLRDFKSLDEIEIKETFIEKFNIDTKNKTLSQLSGGELQKIAIASALSKDADIYFLDEPSSFLDIRERLNVAKIIREFSEKEEKTIVLVEHDLAVLDYLADKIHITFGEPGAYGIVSNSYSTRQGINAFLNGYLKSENVRIGEPIRFLDLEEKREWKEKLITFTKIEKRFENFHLIVEPSEIYRGEILAIFGANSLGKTTFAKILAGILDFEGEISKNIKVSYKPQYISSINSEASVENVLEEMKEKVKSEIREEKNEKNEEEVRQAIEDLERIFNILVEKLELQRIMHKKLKSLSGGELQRVAIALCLMRNADFYLLDEPSAYLDVKQRMSLIKIIKNFGKSIAIIDHDITLLSSLSHRAMLFSGIPKVNGHAKILLLDEALNEFLKELGVTFRLDEETRRPKPNKPNSVKDREQKERNKYFDR